MDQQELDRLEKEWQEEQKLILKEQQEKEVQQRIKELKDKIRTSRMNRKYGRYTKTAKEVGNGFVKAGKATVKTIDKTINNIFPPLTPEEQRRLKKRKGNNSLIGDGINFGQNQQGIDIIGGKKPSRKGKKKHETTIWGL